MRPMDWYLNRLRSMDAAELLHRVDQLRKKRAFRSDRRGWAAFEVGDGPLRLPDALRDRLRRKRPPELDALLSATRAMVRTRRFAFLGANWPAPPDSAGTAILWLVDPVSGQSWPGEQQYCFDVGYRHDGAFGDVKFVWELNRLQVLPALALAGRHEGEEPVIAVLRSWMAANPPFRGVNWNSGIELALRIVSVVVALLLLPDPPDAEGRILVRRFLAAHAFWLAHFPSRHSSANNHLIAEGLGLLLVGFAAPDLSGAVLWRRQGAEIIGAETARQFAPDGVGLEQSPTYTAFSAEMVCLADLFAAASGTPLDGSVRARLACVAGWLHAMMDEAGGVPRIGDDDEGRVIAMPPCREPRYVASVLAALAGHLERPDLAPPRRDPHLRDLLFDSAADGAVADRDLAVFPAGGYSVRRKHLAGRRAMLVFDHGPLGYLSIAAHGHADALAIWMHLDGLPVIVDAGTFLYHSGGAWRDAMRGTPVHNTVAVAGEDSSAIAGPFMWSTKAKARLLDIGEAGTSVAGSSVTAAEHDGYRRRHGVRHQRRLTDLADGFLVEDRLAGGTEPIAVTASWLFHPDCQVEAAEGRFLVSRGAEPLLEVRTPPGFTTEIVVGDERRKLGWYSPRFGERQPAAQLVASGRLGEGWIGTELRAIARPLAAAEMPAPQSPFHRRTG